MTGRAAPTELAPAGAVPPNYSSQAGLSCWVLQLIDLRLQSLQLQVELFEVCLRPIELGALSPHESSVGGDPLPNPRDTAGQLRLLLAPERSLQ